MSSVNPCGVPGGTSANTLADWQMSYRATAQDAIGAPASWNGISNPTSTMSLAEWQCAVNQGMRIGPWDDEQLADAEAGFNAVSACWPCEGSPTGGGYTGACLPGMPEYPACQTQQVLLPSVAARLQSVSQKSGAPLSSFGVPAMIQSGAAAYAQTPTGSQYPGAIFPAGGGTAGMIPQAASIGISSPAGGGSSQPVQPVQTYVPASSGTTTAGTVSGDLSTLVSDLTGNPILLVGIIAVLYLVL